MRYSTFSLEQALIDRGYTCIAGIDEVGRGCLAGPLVAAVVAVTSPSQYIEGVQDSKKMTAKRREDVYGRILDSVEGYAFGEVPPEEIDAVGINEAVSLAMQRAYTGLTIRPDIILVDGPRIMTSGSERVAIIQGDSRHYVISAASVIAKVYRDRMMRELASQYKGYGFERHVGYGTATHVDAISRLGVSKIHRRSFLPVKEIVGWRKPC